ncbi:MAG: hypothetical protein AAB731_05250 [Patescibacteria group bacterium]
MNLPITPGEIVPVLVIFLVILSPLIILFMPPRKLPRYHKETKEPVWETYYGQDGEPFEMMEVTDAVPASAGSSGEAVPTVATRRKR